MKIKIKSNRITQRIILLALSLLPFFCQSKEIADIEKTIDKAVSGDRTSQSDLISYYYSTAKKYDEAIKWCNILLSNPEATKTNKAYANRMLGFCAYDGTGMDKSIESAVSFWKKGVELDDGFSAISLARCYTKELRDSTEAIKWYKVAAELGNHSAAYFLGQLYEFGYTVDTNHNKSFFPGISKDISMAHHFYSIYIKKMGSYRGAVPLNAKLLYKLAEWNYVGEGNLPKDYARAFHLFNESLKLNENSESKFKLTTSEEGNALWCISVCYRFGRGVDKDELTARRYASKAAEKGNANAIALLKE